MLRAPGGATIEAMARAAKWQPHSVRGFLAGVVRKQLGLNLVSVAGDSGRVYRIIDRVASAAA
jgi:stage V sporulation protein SpoVS